MNTADELTVRLAYGCHGRPSVTVFAAIAGLSFFNRLFTNTIPYFCAAGVLGAVT
jgi:hypothetical protein